MNLNFRAQASDGENDLICDNILLSIGSRVATVIFGDDDDV